MENQGIRIRNAMPCETVRRTLSAFTALLTAGLPVMTLLAAIAGILMTRSAMKPIVRSSPAPMALPPATCLDGCRKMIPGLNWAS